MAELQKKSRTLSEAEWQELIQLCNYTWDGFARLHLAEKVPPEEASQRIGRKRLARRNDAGPLAGSVLKNTNVERLVFIYTYFIADLQSYISFCELPKCRDAFRAML